mmetsp:Transcript_16766/g.20128  ORF Transcript_16766/g.20128 Transcript_16766/m.20128 type:complete len:86 (+) Transcript_16766:614-871(+)
MGCLLSSQRISVHHSSRFQSQQDPSNHAALSTSATNLADTNMENKGSYEEHFTKENIIRITRQARDVADFADLYFLKQTYQLKKK